MMAWVVLLSAIIAYICPASSFIPSLIRGIGAARRPLSACPLSRCPHIINKARCPDMRRISMSRASLSKRGSIRSLYDAVGEGSSVLSPSLLPGARRVRLFDSMAGTKREFEPLEPGKVKMYTCGPTVYDSAHIGNFRAFLFYDLLKRVFLYFGYDVEHVCNLTDIDDKILVKALQLNKTRIEVTNKYIRRFFDDIKALNIINASCYAKVSDHLPQIVNMVEHLKQKGFAYQAGNSIYFRVNASKNYNEFAVGGASVENTNATSASNINAIAGEDNYANEWKSDFRDFALWKSNEKVRPGGGRPWITSTWDSTPSTAAAAACALAESSDAATDEVSDAELVKRGLAWNTSLGCGRPGWHIECSAIIHSILGDTIDVHCGGSDLQFPHHANEIAQSEAFTGKRLANYWVHNAFVNINHTKMSKSLNNMYTLSDLAKSDIEHRALRFALISSQYRNAVQFNNESVKHGVRTLKAIDLLVSKLRKIIKNPPTKRVPEPEPDYVEYPKEAIEYVDSTGASDETVRMFSNISDTVAKHIDSFEEAICDDIDIPKALKAFFDFVNFMQKALCIRADDFTPSEASAAIDCLQRMDGVFGVFFPSALAPTVPKATPSNRIDTSTSNDEYNDIRPIDVSDAPAEVTELLRSRAAAKKARDFAASDAIRAQMRRLGYVVVDNRDGSSDLFQVVS